MLKIFKYLKSSWISILATILLLFVQAMLDLTLPDYTSKIVNVGVQQGGIDSSAIERIGEKSLNKLLLFTNNKDKKYILNNYKFEKNYKNEKIYVLKKDSNKDKIDNIFVKPMTIVSYIETSKKGSGKQTIKFEIPENMDIYSALTFMGTEQKEIMINKINKKLKKMPETIINQAGISYVKNEYKRIGIDTNKIQTTYIFKTGFIMIGISLAAMLDGIIIVLIGSKMAAKLAKVLREKVFKKVVGFSKNEIKTYGQSSLITRTTNDV